VGQERTNKFRLDFMKLITTVFLLILSFQIQATVSCREENSLFDSKFSSLVGRTLSSCDLVEKNQYWLCKGLESGNCGVIKDSEEYWFCKGFTTRDCGVIKGDNYWFCKGVTEKNCGLISGSGRYAMCKGITENQCGLVTSKNYWMCEALKRYF
jgi:hypothetical protein